MQSSTAIAFRALVMLIVMISIPLFAIFGRDLPEIVKNLLAGRLVIHVSDAGHGGEPSAGAGNLPKAPVAAAAQTPAISPGPPQNPFSEPASYRAGNSAESSHVQPAALQSAQPPQGSGENGVNLAPVDALAPKGAMAQPAGFQAPPESHPIAQNNFAAPTSPTGTPAPGMVATSASGSQAASQSTAAGTSGDNEQFRRAEARLRELGATHYTLETWGPDNNRYRFVCKMAIGANPEMNRYFQAIEDDPWRAMQSVLEQVEAWRVQQPRQ